MVLWNTLPHNSGGVLWYQVGCQCAHPSVSLQWGSLRLFCHCGVKNWHCGVENLHCGVRKDQRKIKGITSQIPSHKNVHPSVFLFLDDNLTMDFHQTGCVHWYCGDLVWDLSQFLKVLSARQLSVFSFPDDNFCKYNGFSPNLVCAMILWRPGLGLLMGKLRQFLTVICPWYVSIFISGRYFSKYQWIFTKLCVCIDIVET